MGVREALDIPSRQHVSAASFEIMSNLNQQIQADRLQAADSVTIGAHSIIKAREVKLGSNVRIADNVEIICDRLELGEGCSIGAGSVVLCPEIVFEKECSIGKSLQVELNDYLHLGRHSVLGNRVSLAGRGVKSGEFLWMKNDVVVGGGGAQGLRSYLEIGARNTIVDRCFINLAEGVMIGENTALSYNVVLLTHGAWQPVLLGFPAKFAPVRIGNYCVVYLNSVVLPGVTIGDYSTIGACSVVVRDVPAHSLAAGNPARIVKGNPDYPTGLDRGKIDWLIGSILSDYVATLEPKGVRVAQNRLAAEQYMTLVLGGQQHTIGYSTEARLSKFPGKPDITLAYGEQTGKFRGKCHFNLCKEVITGELTDIGEDLRDSLRRRGIRLFTGSSFRGLPLANLKRLKEQRDAHD